MQKGSSKLGPGFIPGSAEYAREWRRRNPDRWKAIAGKYVAKQRATVLATQLAVVEGLTAEQAVAEVQSQLADLSSIRKRLKETGVIAAADSSLLSSLSPSEKENTIPFVVDVAKHYNLPYEFVAALYSDETIDPSTWESRLEEESRRSAAAVQVSPLVV